MVVLSPPEPDARTLAAFLRGECSPAEAARVRRWADSSPERAERLKMLHAVSAEAGLLPRSTAPHRVPRLTRSIATAACITLIVAAVALFYLSRQRAQEAAGADRTDVGADSSTPQTR